MVKDKSGMDNVLSTSDFKNNGLIEKIEKYNPRFICFNGKKAAKEFYGVQMLNMGSGKEYKWVPGFLLLHRPAELLMDFGISINGLTWPIL